MRTSTEAKTTEGSLASRRDLDRVTPDARKEARRLSEEYMRLLFQDAASRGPVNVDSLRAADRRFRRKAQRARLLAYPRTWDTITGLGGSVLPWKVCTPARIRSQLEA